MTIYEEDAVIRRAAHSVGLYDVETRQFIDVDTKELPAEYFRRAPDYTAIRNAVRAGLELPGVRVTADVEYVIHRDRGVGE